MQGSERSRKAIVFLLTQDTFGRIAGQKPIEKGLKMRCKNGKSITVWLDDDTVKRLDKVAKRAGISRSRLTENLILVGLEEAEAMRKIGVLQMAVLLRDLKQRVGDKLNRVENLVGELA